VIQWFCMNKEVYVTKATGEKELFVPEKLLNSLVRSRADEDVARQVVEQVVKDLQPEVSTKQIYKHAFDILERDFQPAAARYSLRKSIMEMGPTGFPFESLVAEIFRHKGFETKTDVMVQGKCVEHEIDIIAWSKEKLIMCEAKFHNELGIKSDLKIALYVNARWEDINGAVFESFGATPSNGRKLDEGWLITNTKFSERAIEYAKCRKMILVGWNYPEQGNLHDLIEEAELHPITCLRSISAGEKKALMAAGIVLCKQAYDNADIVDRAGINREKIKRMMEDIRQIQATVKK
jgi:hypothetical protein